MGYSEILKIAYRVTTQYPGLWLLGIFLGTSFNIQLLVLQTSSNPLMSATTTGDYAGYLYGLISNGALAPFAFIVLFVLGLVVTNWAKVLLVLQLQKILRAFNVETYGFDVTEEGIDKAVTHSVKPPHKNRRELLLESRRALGPVIAVSVFTTSLMILVLAVLSLPFVSFAQAEANGSFMWAAAGLLLAGSAFVISILGMFASFFVVLFRMHARPAINITTDLISGRWHEIAGGVIVFGMVYLALYFLGAYALIALERLIFLYDAGVAQTLRNVLLWGWLSVLNVFFYTAMLLFFLQLIRPQKTEEAETVVRPRRLDAPEV